MLVLAGLTRGSSAQSPGETGSFVAAELLVKFRPGVTAAARADAHRQAGGTQLNEIARTGVQRVAVSRGDELAAIGRYQRNPNVLYAEPNYIRRIPTLTSHAIGSEVLPGDYYFAEQWALHNTGQQFQCTAWIFGDICYYVGTPDADIDAPESWGVSTGSAVRVAVIDSGVDYTHPDLTAKYDGGWDFINNDNDPLDDHGHGTHVSGTIAAAMDNLTGTPAAEEGVVGVAPNARILAYKVCSPDGSCSDFAIAQALDQAITDGAQVINMSLGGSEYSQSMYDGVQAAWTAGLVIVAGAGNDGTTAPFYPAAFANVVSVAAFDEDHRRPSFSNYGNWVDISAPGNVIMSAYRMSACAASEVPGDTGCYTWSSGTSMATPHVSGAAALVWSRSDVTSNSQVVDAILNSADPRGVATTRLDVWTIHGGLNIHNAISYGLINLPPVANAGVDRTVVDTNGDGVELVTLDGSASADPEGRALDYEWSEGGQIVGLGATADVWLDIGGHTVTLKVTDEHGATSTDTVVITVNPWNYAPVATNLSVSTVLGTPVTLTLAATDMETCDLGFSVVQGPSSGTLGAIDVQACSPGTPNRDTAQIVYTPGTTTGTYTFTYRASDGALDSNGASVTISVKRGKGRK
jgi:thermitase